MTLTNIAGFVTCGDYADTIDNFLIDSGAALPVGDRGMRDFRYYSATRVLVWYDATQNAFPNPGTTVAPDLDAIVAGRVDMIARQAARRLAERDADRAALARAEQVLRDAMIGASLALETKRREALRIGNSAVK